MTTLPDGTNVENWTNHAIMLVIPSEGVTLNIPMEAGAPARVSIKHESIPGHWLLTRSILSPNVEHFPAPRPGVFLIVSSLFMSCFDPEERDDLIVPDRLIRSGNGEVTACQCFAM